MKKSEITPNTIYRTRESHHGTKPAGFDKFVLTGDEITAVATDQYGYSRDRTTKRYIKVYRILWDYSAHQFVVDADTRQIAFKDIDGDYGEQGSLDEITEEELNRRAMSNEATRKAIAQENINKVRWAALDTATLDLLNVGEYDRPGAWNEYSNSLTSGNANGGRGSIKVTLTLDAIETINALLATQAVSA